MINVGVLGFGYWGPNLVRNFLSIGSRVKTIADMNDRRLSAIRRMYPSIDATKDIGEVIEDTEIDALVIALPVSLHHEVAKRGLLAGKHILVEKPMTTSSETSRELVDLAIRKGKIIMCDHTFLYTDAVAQMKKLVSSGEIGKLEYFDSVRINLGLFQGDVNVIWDLATHDISILTYLTNEEPISVTASGLSHLGNNIENIAYLTMHYGNDFIAHSSVSWISPVKIRRILIGGQKKMIVFDDIEPTEKVKIYDFGYRASSPEEQNKLRIDYRTGDIHIPKLNNVEALATMAQDFINAVEHNTAPISSTTIALSVVKILEAAEMSLRNEEKVVRLV